MGQSRVYVLTRSAHAEDFRERVVRDVVPGKRDLALVLAEDDFRGSRPGAGGGSDVDILAKRISDAIDDSDSDTNSFLLIDREVRASHRKLISRWKASGRDESRVHVNERSIVFQRLDRALMDLELHWRPHATLQLQKFLGQTTPLQDWCAQFSSLKVSYLGRRIAMQLRVIGFQDSGSPFSPRAHESIGQDLIHCYFDDGDHGGSWISVRDQLSHDLPKENVEAISVEENSLKFPERSADEFVVYEDGLWSGSEFVKRIKLIASSGILFPVRFKFLVVTDFGLLVARHAIRFYRLEGRVRVDASDSSLERYLRADLPDTLKVGSKLDPESYFLELHQYVECGVFRNSDDWPEGVSQARADAKEIGSQLVRRWYESSRKSESVDRGVEKFCLGGGGFASTLVFQRSVPKVCLPLLWLSGEVTLNGITLVWKPLFRDVRRVPPDLLKVV